MSALAAFAGSAPVILGVLNATPDSFSDGGKYADPASAVARGRELAAAGAHVIDVGGESTRPGAEPVSRVDEHARVIPVIEQLAAAGLTVSIDTIHADTAAAAVVAGARIINDVSGGLHDPEMLAVAARASSEHGVALILGHWRGIPDPEHLRSQYRDVVVEVRDALAERAAAATAAGVDARHIVLDPGLGFDKTGEQCWEILRRIDELQALGYPVLIGASRKRMLGEVLATVPGTATTPTDRDGATAVVSALAARAGIWGVRVHDVAGTAAANAVAAAWAGPPREDKITLTGLEVFAHHGVFDFEREQGQRFLIDAEVSVDLRAAAAGDELANTVHYGELADAIVAAVAADPVDLIETVADRVAQLALGFSGVSRARVSVHKPDAPIAHPFADVAVTVERERTAP
ncbi:dihydropteroate synthase [Leucobacter sp. BZR 635]